MKMLLSIAIALCTDTELSDCVVNDIHGRLDTIISNIRGDLLKGVIQEQFKYTRKDGTVRVFENMTYEAILDVVAGELRERIAEYRRHALVVAGE